MAVGWDALHWTSRAIATMRERRRAERAGLDAEGQDVYASEVYEERRSRRRERILFAGADARAFEILALFDKLAAHGESERVTILRGMLGVSG